MPVCFFWGFLYIYIQSRWIYLLLRDENCHWETGWNWTQWTSHSFNRRQTEVPQILQFIISLKVSFSDPIAVGLVATPSKFLAFSFFLSKSQKIMLPLWIFIQVQQALIKDPLNSIKLVISAHIKIRGIIEVKRPPIGLLATGGSSYFRGFNIFL